MRSRESCDSEAIFMKPSYCSLCYFEPRYISHGLKPLLLTQFRMYKMYLSSQSSVLAIILNQAIHQRALNPYQSPTLEKGHNHSLICHHQGLFLCNLIYLTVVYFTFIYFISNLITFINLVWKLY